MKRWFWSILLIPALLSGQSVPVTPAVGFYIPVPGTPNWGTYLNANFNKLDSMFAGLTAIPSLNVFNTATFNNIVVNGFCTGIGCGGQNPPAGVLYDLQAAGMANHFFADSGSIIMIPASHIIQAAGGFLAGSGTPGLGCSGGSGCISIALGTDLGTPQTGQAILQGFSAGNNLQLSLNGGAFSQICTFASGCGASGNVSSSGTPSAHQTAVWVSSSAIKGVGPGTSGQVLTSNGASSDPSFQNATGGVTSVSGDGALIGNSSSTGAVTLTIPATTLAHKYWGNNTGSTTAAGFSSIVAGDLPTIPIAGGGTNATSAAAGTVPNATSSSASSWTATPTLGASGTLGSLTFGNATSGTVTMQTATGPLSTYTIQLLPAAQPTSGNTFINCTAANPSVCTFGSPLRTWLYAMQGTCQSGNPAFNIQWFSTTGPAPTAGDCTTTTITPEWQIPASDATKVWYYILKVPAGHTGSYTTTITFRSVATSGTATMQLQTTCVANGAVPDNPTYANDGSAITLTPAGTTLQQVTASGTFTGTCADGAFLYVKYTFTANTVANPIQFRYSDISIQASL